MAKSVYRGNLPKPDRRGDVRPEIAGKRCTVGNVRDSTETQMLHRLNTLRDVFRNQSKYYGTDGWSDWLLPYAQEYARTGRVIVQHDLSDETDLIRRAVFRSGDELVEVKGTMRELDAWDAITLVEAIRSVGLPAESAQQDAVDTGLQFLQRTVDEQFQRAIARSLCRDR